MLTFVLINIGEDMDELEHDSDNPDLVLINYEQFMEIMTRNIIKNREKFGKENIVFESGMYSLNTNLTTLTF